MLVFDIILMMLLLMLLMSLCPQVSLLPLLLRMATPTHLPLPLLLLLGGSPPPGLVSTIPPRTPTTWVHAHPPYRRKQQTLKQKENNILHCYNNILEVTKSPLLYKT